MIKNIEDLKEKNKKGLICSKRREAEGKITPVDINRPKPPVKKLKGIKGIKRHGL